MFRLAIPEFKTECSKRRFIVREFTYSEETIKSDKEQVTALEAEKRKTYPVLFKWLKVNFAEAYQAWIHIKVCKKIEIFAKHNFRLCEFSSRVSYVTAYPSTFAPLYLSPAEIKRSCETNWLRFDTLFKIKIFGLF